MGLALLYPEPPRGRGKIDPATKSAEAAEISGRRVRQARQVLSYSRDLALAVRDGTRQRTRSAKLRRYGFGLLLI